MAEALVNKILPFSSVDGPGNRTVIFFQGCNFNCLYCHNPETINRCTGCGLCLDVCPAGALRSRNGRIEWNSANCTGCDACLAACPGKSSPKAVSMSVNDIMKTVEKVKPFISGITVSGGECTMQKEFLAELFDAVHKLGLTSYVDTNGCIDFSKEPELTFAMDKAMLDIKSYDDGEHRMLTGMSNALVLKNAEFLANKQKLYEIRTVIVPGILDNNRNVAEVSRLIAKLDADIRYKLIRFRPVGVSGDIKKVGIPSDELMAELKKTAEKNGCRYVSVV